ncbi:MAG: ABC transporter ATP-binding protein [Erysipelotrichaceae bacterium]|nr:ABC transporter ATP-binding protein [Erysipelotrichaceae bacterium]
MKKVKILFKIVFKISKSYPYIFCILALLNMLQLLFNAYIPKILLDAISQYSLIQCLFITLILISVSKILSILIAYTTKKQLALQEKIRYGIYQSIHEKLNDLPYRYLEDADFLLLKESVLFPMVNQNSITQILNLSLEMVKNILNIIAMSIVLFSLGYEIIIVLALGTLGSLIVNRLSKKTMVKFYQRLIPINREMNYYLNDMVLPKMQKEYRLFQAKEMVMEKLDNVIKQMDDFVHETYFKSGIYNTLLQMISSIESIIIYALILIKTISLQLTVGEFSLYTSSAISIFNSISSIVEKMSRFLQVMNYLQPIEELFNLDNENNGLNKFNESEINEIRFEDVSFKYPKSETYILKHLNFTIHKNEKISIVGLNGAGKTTLVKLLCRFYQPTSGKIYINNQDIQQYDIHSYQQMLSCVFQDFQTFAYSLKENIMPNCKNSQKSLLQQVGLEGIDENIMLNRQFGDDAIELSGGQSQRLAIARAIYKNAPVMVLDEPTSALDPIFENEIYELYNSMIKDKIGIYISHRMSSSKFCDKILVIDKGQVIDFDSHEQLMKNTNSLYYQLYMTQAKNYQI